MRDCMLVNPSGLAGHWMGIDMNYESLRLRKKDSFIHPGSAKKFSSCNGFIEHRVNYFTDSCDKRDKTPDGLRHE
jgi:hypothetical protein